MPERVIRRGPPRQRQPVDPLVAAAQVFAANQSREARDKLRSRDWQDELWGFHATLSEFAWSVSWLANAMSRVRLMAAETVPGGEEPTPVTEGPAAEIVEAFGGLGGHSTVLKQLTFQLSVPGEGWVVTEPGPAGTEQWSVRSTGEIRVAQRRGTAYEVREDTNEWRALPPAALVTRVHDPDPRYQYEPTSLARSALPIMRRIDLLDRRIVAAMVSRLAMNGFLLIPQEGTYTVPERYKEAADPFVSMIIDIASNNIQHPGSASAAIPMPIKFTTDLIEKWRHLTFGDAIDTELLEERDKELRRLATGLNVPAEIILGMGDANHWTAWQLEESAIKLHIAPLAETIVHALTVGWLYPLLEEQGLDAVGPDGGQLVLWYDASELTARPDKSEQAIAAYDRFELSGRGLRRETGLDEGDVPTNEELKEQILKRLAGTIQVGLTALAELTGAEIAAPPPQTPADGAVPGGPVGDEPDESGESDSAPSAGPGTPGTRDEPPPPPNQDTAARYIVPDLPPRQKVLVPATVAAGGEGPPNGRANGARPPPARRRGGRR